MPDTTRLFSRLIRLLPILHIVSLIAVILQPSQPPIFLQRYSRISIVIFVGLLISLPLVVWLSRWLNRRLEKNPFSPTTFQRGFILVAIAVLLIGLGFLASLPTNSYGVLSFYGVYALCVLGLWLVGSPVQAQDFKGRRWLWIGAVVVIGLVVLAAHFPGQYWTDEGYNTGLALSIARDGQFAIPMFKLTPELYGPNYSLIYVALAAVYRIFGVSLANGRVLFYLVGLLTLAVISRVVRYFYSETISWTVFIIGAIVVLASNYMRADIEVALWLGLGLWFFALAYTRNQPRWHILVGLAVGFSADGHPNAYRFIAAFAVAYVPDYLVQMRAARRWIWPTSLIYLTGGAFAGLLVYIGLYTILAPTSFGGRINTIQILFNGRALFTQAVAQFSSALQHGSLLVGLALFGAAVSLIQHNTFDRLLIVVPIVSGIVLAVLYGYYRDYYFVHLLPFYVLLAAAALGYLERQLPPIRASLYMTALMLFLLCAAAGWLAGKMIANRSQDYGQAQDVAEKIRAFIPQDATFIGVDPLYLRMSDYPNFVEFNVGLFMALRDHIDERTAWERINPSSVIIIEDYPIKPPESLLAYVREQHFTLVHCWDANHIGRVDLYMQTVPKDANPSADCEPLVS
jgi:hypothetical protein